MAFGVTFKRYEKKYLISPYQYSVLKAEIDKHFVPDEYGETKICNLYLDTSDFVLIRRSVDKPTFKEKARLRTYGTPNDDSTAFIEIKRKFNSIVYKRRIHMSYADGLNCVNGNYEYLDDKQISAEIKYLFEHYGDIRPRFYVSYDRRAFFYKETKDIRITFDRNLVWRDYDLDLSLGSHGDSLLPDGYVLMEIKVPNTVPLWLAKLLSELKIYPRSFSKIGTAYKTLIGRKIGASAVSVGNPCYNRSSEFDFDIES